MATHEPDQLQRLAPNESEPASRRVSEVAKVAGVLVGFVLVVLMLTRVERSMLDPDVTRPSTSGGGLAGFLDRTDGLAPGTAPEELPSSLAVRPSRLDPERSYLSISVERAALRHPASGLLTNPTERGRDWERFAYASFFEGSRLTWASRVGLRRHGGSSRLGSNRPSWRLYLREEYGTDLLNQPLDGDFAAEPTRIIVRREPRGQPNVFALSIAKQSGVIVPAFRPVRLVLNGDNQGNYVLFEHINVDGWGWSHFGHRDFVMFIYRGGRTPEADRRYGELTTWVETAPAPLTMAAVSDRVDLDNLLRHLFTIMFAGTQDWAQGAAVLDTSRTGATWFWVHWDLDKSFRLEGSTSAGPSIEIVTDPGRPNEVDDVRARIFNRLRVEDPAFGAYFTALAQQLLDERLTEDFLDELLERYGNLFREEQAVVRRDQLTRRAEVLRDELRRHFGPGAR